MRFGTRIGRGQWLAHGGLLLLLLGGAAPAAAQGGAISQGYQTSGSSISAGALVSLTASGSGQVELATASNGAHLVGIAAEASTLELSTVSGQHSIQVVVGGTSEVLVSDANGALKAGDRVTVSPLAGIGMKATGSGEVVGTALKPLSSVKTVVQQAKGADGQSVIVHVGLVPVAVSVVYYSAVASVGTVSAFVPPFLQNVANAVAGKVVSPLRVLIGTIALLLGFLAVTIMLYVGVRSGVVSLGRNPLAADALRRGMVDILVAALGVLIVTGVIASAVILA
jgi:hypothetical protein